MLSVPLINDFWVHCIAFISYNGLNINLLKLNLILMMAIFFLNWLARVRKLAQGFNGLF